MGSIDVGSNDRWEHFLIGEPLARVAIAESKAEKGDLVICPETHNLIHGNAVHANNQAGGKVVKRKRLSLMALNPFKMESGPQSPANSAHLRPDSSNSPPKKLDTMNSSPKVGPKIMVPHHIDSDVRHGGECMCSCVQLDNGYFRMCKSVTPKAVTEQRRSRTKTKLEQSMRMDGEVAHEHKISQSIEIDIHTAFEATLPIFKADLLKMFETGDINKLNAMYSAAVANSTSMLKNSVKRRVSLMTRNVDQGALFQELFEKRKLHKDFLKWLHKCLLDDMARHVHEVARNNFTFKGVSRAQPFMKFIENTLKDNGANKPKLEPINMAVSSKSGDFTSLSLSIDCGSGPTSDEEDTGVARQALNAASDDDCAPRTSGDGGDRSAGRRSGTDRTRKYSKMNTLRRLTVHDVAMDAELRNVIVLFIKIDLQGMDIFMEDSSTLAEKFCTESNYFGFLSRTPNELQYDNTLLQNIQCCLNILTTTFMSKGGQMRQFIVDDKGTVCIGTFGLRGAVNDDNCAAAMEAAKQIIISLQGINLHASIGVTCGKDYCGLVGSANRHEYAVMGPSVNLSARLMCKAPPCSIICDIETKNRDRMHHFECLGEVVAKGYKDPVPTFRPIFSDVLDGATGIESTEAFSSLMRSLNMRSSFAVRQKKNLGCTSDDLNEPTEPITAINSLDVVSSKEAILALEESSFKAPSRPLRMMRQVTKTVMKVRSKLKHNASLASIPAQQSTNGTYLRGRTQEINQILAFCLYETVGHEANGNALEATDDSTTTSSVFSSTVPTKHLILIGSQGIGKASIISSITSQIISTAKASNDFNVSLFKNQPCSLNLNIAFYAWKPIIREMLIKIHRYELSQQQEDKPTLTRQNSNIVSAVDDIEKGFDYIVSLEHSKEYAALKPLLAAIGFIPPMDDNEITKEFAGQMKLHRTAELLAVIIQTYVLTTKDLVIFTMYVHHLFFFCIGFV